MARKGMAASLLFEEIVAGRAALDLEFGEQVGTELGVAGQGRYTLNHKNNYREYSDLHLVLP